MGFSMHRLKVVNQLTVKPEHCTVYSDYTVYRDHGDTYMAISTDDECATFAKNLGYEKTIKERTIDVISLEKALDDKYGELNWQYEDEQNILVKDQNQQIFIKGIAEYIDIEYMLLEVQERFICNSVFVHERTPSKVVDGVHYSFVDNFTGIGEKALEYIKSNAKPIDNVTDGTFYVLDKKVAELLREYANEHGRDRIDSCLSDWDERTALIFTW